MIQSSALIKVYDTEFIVECPEENAEKVAQRLTDVMKHAAEPEVTIPFKCDADISKVWYYNDYSALLRKEFNELKEEKGEDFAISEIYENHTECLKEQINEILNIA